MTLHALAERKTRSRWSKMLPVGGQEREKEVRPGLIGDAGHLDDVAVAPV